MNIKFTLFKDLQNGESEGGQLRDRCEAAERQLREQFKI